jgi:hypothetical protein
MVREMSFWNGAATSMTSRSSGTHTELFSE